MNIAHVPICDWEGCIDAPELEVKTDDDWQPMCSRHAHMWLEVCRASEDAEGRELGKVAPRPFLARH